MPGEQGKTVTHGLILRDTDTKETDKILTVLTAEMGKISVIARGARRKNSRLAAACQLFAWSEMTLYRRGNWYYLDAAEPEELFSGLQKDLVRFSLAAYLAELTEFVAGEETEAGELLRLLLNGLYALGNLGRDPALVKPAFTFRLLALAGFEPDRTDVGNRGAGGRQCGMNCRRCWMRCRAWYTAANAAREAGRSFPCRRRA